ncbi:MAG: hypothetical protein GX557_06165 [Chloroflexi bacterium]|nr:hypothetical protein [Chloroflexota bacterium]
MLKRLVPVLVSVALLMLSSVTVLAEDSQQPRSLVNDQAIGNVLAGDAAGSFDYYRLSYPGNSTDVRIQVSVSPYSAIAERSAGFHVYGPNGRVDSGDWKSDDCVLEVTYQEEDPAELTIQVFNYGSSPITYTIAVRGLSQVTAETPVESSASETIEIDVATAPTASCQGALLGNPGGAVALHKFHYAGDESDCVVSLSIDPGDPCFGTAFGLNIFAPDGSLAARGEHTDLYSVVQATLNSDVVGDYTAQVYNYTDGTMLYYTMEVE